MYCTVTDIEAYYLNKTFKCADWITNSEVETFINSESASIEAQISARYSFPITNKNDLMILKMIVEKFVVAIVDDIIRDRDKEGRFTRQRDCRKEADALLKLILEGALVLQATQVSSTIRFNDQTSDGETVEKRYKDSNIEPINTTIDRETRRLI